MANTRLTDLEVVHYINYFLGGESYIQTESKGDAVKAEKLRAEIVATGAKKGLTFKDVGDLVNTVIKNVVNPHITMVDESTLLLEMLLQRNVPALNKVDDLVEVLHDNGDLSDKSYDYIKKRNFKQEQSDFKEAAKEVRKVQEEARKKLEEQNAKVMAKKQEQESETLAKATYNPDKSDKVINLKNTGK